MKQAVVTRKKPSNRKAGLNRLGNRQPASPGGPAGSRGAVWGVCLFLIAITLAVFGRTARYDFVNLDDDGYIYANPEVTRGLTLDGLRHAFTRGSDNNWDPLTTISHMVDCQFYGLNAGGHHVTNVLMHTFSVVLLFLVLRNITGSLWPGAFVAAVFAIHPLKVESVAWVSERKDVFSGVFFMLTLGAYARYVRRPGPGAYGVVLALFALGLMCKAMLVTLPFVLLVLDWWPLKRFASATTGGTEASNGWWLNRIPVPGRLFVEKIPLVTLSLASFVLAELAQSRGNAIHTGGKFMFILRMENAINSVFTYLVQTFYPARLAVYYPFPSVGRPAWEWALPLAALTAVSAAAFFWRRQRPYLLAGWLWYLIMLAPVIGLVQLGTQAHADRYTYLPQIGLCIALSWLAAGALGGWRHRRVALGSICLAIVAALGIASIKQVGYWRDGETLWRRDVDCASESAFAHDHLGLALSQHGQADEATEQFRKAVALEPDFGEALNNLGTMLRRAGKLDDAVTCFEKASATAPVAATAFANIGTVRLQQGRVDDAITNFQQALKADPDLPQAHYYLGNALLQKQQVEPAITEYQAVLKIQPRFALAENSLTSVAWMLATSPDASMRNGARAVELALQVEESSDGKDPAVLATLAAAYAEAGKFSDATVTARRALDLFAARPNSEPQIAMVRQELATFESGMPCRDPSVTNVPGPAGSP